MSDNEGAELDRAVLDEKVQKEIEELKLAGRLYQFKPEPRCKVCRHSNNGLMNVVNKLLAAGESYSNIIRDIEPLNEQQEEGDRITYSSLRTHHKRHFNKDEAAAAVYRRILEKNAAQSDIDFVDGVVNAVTPMAYLETTMNKGYQSLISPDGYVSVELGMNAALHLEKLTQGREGGEDLQELVDKTNRLIEIVREVVPVSYWDKIVKRIEEEEFNSRGDVVDAEIEPDDVDTSDDFFEDNYDEDKEF